MATATCAVPQRVPSADVYRGTRPTPGRPSLSQRSRPQIAHHVPMVSSAPGNEYSTRPSRLSLPWIHFPYNCRPVMPWLWEPWKPSMFESRPANFTCYCATSATPTFQQRLVCKVACSRRGGHKMVCILSACPPRDTMGAQHVPSRKPSAQPSLQAGTELCAFALSEQLYPI